MKTFKQILSEARPPQRSKGPPKKMELEIDPRHLGDGTNDRGISYQVLHDLPAEHGNLLDTLGNYATKPGVHIKPKYGKPFNSVDMQSRGKRVGAWLHGDQVSYFPSDMASHGSAKKFTVAAGGEGKSYPVHVSWNSRDHATVHYHGNEPLTDEEKNAIVNHDGLNRNFKKITLQTDQ